MPQASVVVKLQRVGTQTFYVRGAFELTLHGTQHVVLRNLHAAAHRSVVVVAEIKRHRTHRAAADKAHKHGTLVANRHTDLLGQLRGDMYALGNFCQP